MTITRGMNMASAMRVVDADPNGFAWLMIQDSDGECWKYFRVGEAPSEATTHLPIHVGPQSEFVLAMDGKQLLSQDGAGILRKIVVAIESRTPQPAAPVGVAGAWEGWHTYEYEQRP
jgi:hypothetical protein